jgi:hydrogenase nickel incorporation protein HypA/HybF
MHELTFAQKLIETAQAALTDQTDQVVALHIQLGAQAGLSKDELIFGFGIAAADTPFAGARLEIEEVLPVIYCPQCDARFMLAATDALVCPACNTPQVQVMRGKEVLLQSIEVTDDEEARGQGNRGTRGF